MIRTDTALKFVPGKGNLTIFSIGRNEIHEAGIIWRKLEKEIRQAGLLSGWDWVETWLKFYADVIDFEFLIGSVSYKPVGIVLIVKEIRRPLPIPLQAYHIGTFGEPYQEQVRMINNRLLVSGAYFDDYVSALIRFFRTNYRFDEIVFDLLDKTQAEHLTNLLSLNNFRFGMKKEICRYLDFGTVRLNGGDVIASFSHDMRRAIRRNLRFLKGDLITQWAEDAHESEEILAELVRLYNADWRKTGRVGMFASKRFLNFQKEAVRKLVPEDKAVLFRVKSKTYGTIGCLFLFIDDNIAFTYQIGLQDFTTTHLETISRNRFKPGYLMHFLCMQECYKRGMKAYNFLTGDYAYKARLTDKTSEVISVSIQNNYKPVLRQKIMDLYGKLDNDRNEAPVYLKFLRKFNII